MPKVRKSLELSAKTQKIKTEADRLLSEGVYLASILYYTIYVEQLLLTADLYIIRRVSIDDAIAKREHFLRLKENVNFSFGKVVRETLPDISEELKKRRTLTSYNETKPDLSDLCHQLRLIRNAASAHPHFLLMLDPTQQWKRGLSDVGYYRKVLRRIRRFMVDKLNMASPSILNTYLNGQTPLQKGSRLDKIFTMIDESVSNCLAQRTKDLAEQIRFQLRLIIP